jgi:hypothetical protein
MEEMGKIMNPYEKDDAFKVNFLTQDNRVRSFFSLYLDKVNVHTAMSKYAMKGVFN